MPKSQLEVMSTDWERSQVWPSPPPLPSPNEPPDEPPPADGADEGHFSRSTSWSIRTISHIPVSSLVTCDCRMWARMMAGLSRKAILSTSPSPLCRSPVLCPDVPTLSPSYRLKIPQRCSVFLFLLLGVISPLHGWAWMPACQSNTDQMCNY